MRLNYYRKYPKFLLGGTPLYTIPPAKVVSKGRKKALFGIKIDEPPITDEAINDKILKLWNEVRNEREIAMPGSYIHDQILMNNPDYNIDGIRPMSLAEVQANQSFMNNDDRRKYSPILYRKERYPAVEAYRRLFSELKHQLDEKNGSRKFKNKNDTIHLAKDENGNSSTTIVNKQPLRELIQAAKSIGMNPIKALGIAYNESTLGAFNSLYQWFPTHASKEEVTNAANNATAENKDRDYFIPSQILGLDHPDPDLKVNYALPLLKIWGGNDEYILRTPDNFGGFEYDLTQIGAKAIEKELDKRFKNGNVPLKLISSYRDADKFVKNFDPNKQSLIYFQKNPQLYNRNSYQLRDTSDNPNNWSPKLKRIINVLDNNPEVKELLNE